MQSIDRLTGHNWSIGFQAVQLADARMQGRDTVAGFHWQLPGTPPSVPLEMSVADGAAGFHWTMVPVGRLDSDKMQIAHRTSGIAGPMYGIVIVGFAQLQKVGTFAGFSL